MRTETIWVNGIPLQHSKKYHCANGAHHTYKCCPTCWNNHPKCQKNKDYRMQKDSEYPNKTDSGIIAYDGI